MEVDGADDLVRHLDANGGNFVRNRRDAHARDAQRQRKVAREIRELGELHTLVELDVVARDRGSARRAGDIAGDAEALDGAVETVAVEGDLLPAVDRAARRCLEKAHRRVAVLVRLVLLLALDGLADCRRLGGDLLGLDLLRRLGGLGVFAHDLRDRGGDTRDGGGLLDGEGFDGVRRRAGLDRRLRNGLCLRQRGRSGHGRRDGCSGVFALKTLGEHLIRRFDARTGVEKADLVLRRKLLRLRTLLAVNRNVDRAAAFSGGFGRGSGLLRIFAVLYLRRDRGGDALLSARRLLLRILRARGALLPGSLRKALQRHAAGAHAEIDETADEHRNRAVNADSTVEADGRAARDHAAADKLAAAVVEPRDRIGVKTHNVGDDQVVDRAEENRAKERRNDAEGDGPAPAEEEICGAQEHRDREKIVAPADQALDEAAEIVDEPRVHVRVADEGKERQKQADDPADDAFCGIIGRCCRLHGRGLFRRCPFRRRLFCGGAFRFFCCLSHVISHSKS